jgi:predicted subunit of tRNA(5-methylaminomethyl-2-thiouridylate) methyltransferase
VQAGWLQRELIELRAEFFSNMDAEYRNDTTNELATEMMQSIEEKTVIRYSERLCCFVFYIVNFLLDRISITQKGNSFAKPAGTSPTIQKYS